MKVEQNQEGIRTRLVELRETLGMSQAEFGRRVGYSDPYVSQIERGIRPINLRFFNAVLSGFEVSPIWLKNGAGKMFPVEPAKASVVLDSVSDAALLAELERRLNRK